jgi:hypothetical protein
MHMGMHIHFACPYAGLKFPFQLDIYFGRQTCILEALDRHSQDFFYMLKITKCITQLEIDMHLQHLFYIPIHTAIYMPHIHVLPWDQPYTGSSTPRGYLKVTVI